MGGVREILSWGRGRRSAYREGRRLAEVREEQEQARGAKGSKFHGGNGREAFDVL